MIQVENLEDFHKNFSADGDMVIFPGIVSGDLTGRPPVSGGKMGRGKGGDGHSKSLWGSGNMQGL